MENYDVEQVKPVLNQITNISQTDKQYATGIMGRTLKQIDAKIAPSVLTKGIPTITFESFSKIFSKNKRKVNGNDILNYVYNPFFNDYGIVACSKENDSLIFGYFKEIDKKLKVDKIINNNMNEEFIAAVTEIILEEITKNKTKIIEFNRKSFGDIFIDIKDILEKNGYYYNKKSNISGYFVFEDGLDKINEMEDWDFREKDQQEKSLDGDLSPLSITLEKKPDTGMNESNDINVVDLLNRLTKTFERKRNFGMGGDCGMFALALGNILNNLGIHSELIFFIESGYNVEDAKSALDNELLCYHVALEINGLPKGELYDADGINHISEIDKWISEEYNDHSDIFGEQITNKNAILYIDNDTNWKNDVTYYTNFFNKNIDKKITESLSQQDQTDVTAAIGILSSELTKDQNAKNNTVDSSLTKLTPNQKDALKRTAPQSMTNSKNLGDLVTNVGKELTSKGDTIASDRQDTNKNKEVVKPYGTEQPIKPNTNGINY